MPGQTRWSIPLPHHVPNSSFVAALARALHTAEADADSIVHRCAQLTGKRWRWLRPLTQRYLQAFGDRPRPRHRAVVQFLLADTHLQDALYRHREALQLQSLLPPAPSMNPVAAAAPWNLPAILSIGELAQWFRLTPQELAWFADLKGLTGKHPHTRLRHYHYRILAKESGSIRLIEAPKSHLKILQRQILADILDRIPPHPAAHGFVPGRSIRSFAALHVGQAIVLRMDLQDFFPSIRNSRTQAIFRTFGYPEAVADLLGGLCTNAAPYPIWRGLPQIAKFDSFVSTRELYAHRHLPQGAPTSPALANICAYRADCRLAALAASAGATYTRYADDLAFSGDARFASTIQRFVVQVGAILSEEGFRVQHRKTRIMRQGVRQYLAGLVTNQHLNIPRPDFDRLKAILTNCVHHGPASQNREAHPDFRAHLLGRIAFVASINPGKAQRLAKTFQQIQW